jgi:hypothetical protein
MTWNMLDSQQTEIIGRNFLVNELLRAGLEVARPERDHGVDLLVYLEDPWVARPIQLKAATGAVFSIDAKYARLPDLLIAFVWYAGRAGEEEALALTYAEVLDVADKLGWTETASCLEGRKYANTRPGARVRELLEPYRMSPDRWRGKMLEPTSGGAALDRWAG